MRYLWHSTDHYAVIILILPTFKKLGLLAVEPESFLYNAKFFLLAKQFQGKILTSVTSFLNMDFLLRLTSFACTVSTPLVSFSLSMHLILLLSDYQTHL